MGVKDNHTMIQIRPEQLEDIAAVRRVNERAFNSPAEADLVDRLREHGGARTRRCRNRQLDLAILEGIREVAAGAFRARQRGE